MTRLTFVTKIFRHAPGAVYTLIPKDIFDFYGITPDMIEEEIDIELQDGTEGTVLYSSASWYRRTPTVRIAFPDWLCGPGDLVAMTISLKRK